MPNCPTVEWLCASKKCLCGCRSEVVHRGTLQEIYTVSAGYHGDQRVVAVILENNQRTIVDLAKVKYFKTVPDSVEVKPALAITHQPSGEAVVPSNISSRSTHEESAAPHRHPSNPDYLTKEGYLNRFDWFKPYPKYAAEYYREREEEKKEEEREWEETQERLKKYFEKLERGRKRRG